MIEERDVLVTLRDGVKCAVDVFRPSSKGKFPALLALSPYGKGHESLPLPPQPRTSAVYARSIEAGDPKYLVDHRYVHVIADLRGIGNSGGEYRGWMSKKDAEDGYDSIEWIAKQPWCDGNVGMVGISYFGTIQLVVAAEQPPHLMAIMPWNAVADYYREATHHGGILQTFFLGLYLTSIANKRSVTVTTENLSSNEYSQLLKEMREDPDIRGVPEVFRVIDTPEMCPCFLDVVLNPYDNEFYWERSPYKKYNKIRIPFYTSSGWWAYAHMHLSGAFDHFAGIKAPKKLLIYGQEDTESPLPNEYNDEVIRWYDYWLKHKNTRVMREPPIRIYVMGQNEWRFEKEWPLKRTVWTKFYLRRWEVLSTQPEPGEGREDCFVQQPVQETSTIQAVKYLTEPLSNNIEVTGPVAFSLYASIDQEDTNWMIGLKDVFSDRSELEVSKGFLKASHREIDKKNSKPYRPFHPHLRSEKIEAKRVYNYEIALAPTSNIFKTGHRIKVEIKSMDLKGRVPEHIGQGHYPYHVCSSKTTLHKVYHDKQRASHILLPIIPHFA